MAKKSESNGIGFKLSYDINPETLTQTEEEKKEMSELNRKWSENASKWADGLRKKPMSKLSVTYTEPRGSSAINVKGGMSYE